jgi:hypothetical protein
MDTEFNRFDFEQQLLRCWAIIDDLKDVKEALRDEDNSNNDTMIAYLNSICVLYEMKFNELFKQFGTSIQKPSDNVIFVCAGNIIQYDGFVKQFRDTSQFRFLNWPDQLRGMTNPIVHYIGTYENRKDYVEIQDMVKLSTRKG